MFREDLKVDLGIHLTEALPQQVTKVLKRLEVTKF